MDNQLDNKKFTDIYVMEYKIFAKKKVEFSNDIEEKTKNSNLEDKNKYIKEASKYDFFIEKNDENLKLDHLMKRNIFILIEGLLFMIAFSKCIFFKNIKNLNLSLNFYSLLKITWALLLTSIFICLIINIISSGLNIAFCFIEIDKTAKILDEILGKKNSNDKEIDLIISDNNNEKILKEYNSIDLSENLINLSSGHKMFFEYFIPKAEALCLTIKSEVNIIYYKTSKKFEKKFKNVTEYFKNLKQKNNEEFKDKGFFEKVKHFLERIVESIIYFTYYIYSEVLKFTSKCSEFLKCQSIKIFDYLKDLFLSIESFVKDVFNLVCEFCESAFVSTKNFLFGELVDIKEAEVFL